MLNRVRTETDVVNGPSGVERFAWTYGYDDLGNRVTIEDPVGGTSSAVFNEASEQTSVIDEAGEITVFAYDLAGRVVAVTDPDGVTVESGFDLAGRLVESRQVPAGTGAVLVTGYGWDEAGNQTTVTPPRGYTTTTQYDALGRPVGVSQPVSATEQVVTGYGFDAAGNLTRVTDGRGNLFEYGYNSWNLQETVTEPTTAQHPAVSDREWRIGYDAGGLAVAEAQPAAVLITRQFDTLGRMTTETGTGVGVAAASRSLSFDKGGLLTGVSHPGGDLVYGFDERGLITTASGPAGTASFGYDGLGRVTSRTDDAGIHGFTWTARSELDTVADPISGLVFDYDWTAGGRVDAVTYGTSGMTRDYGYDGYGRLDTDELRDGATVLQGFSFGYDPDGNVTSRSVTAPGNPQAGIHGYGYDRAGRLTSWTPPGAPQVTYGWDASGNRVTAGSDSYVFDERNRLVSGPDGAYTYSPRGTLESVGAVSYSFDALGRLVDYDSQAAFTYDGLDRVATRNTDTFTYAGMWLDPTTDGVFTYSRTPAGRLVAQTDGTSDWLFGQDRHGDVTALINPATASVTDTRLYDPFGDVAAQTGSTNPTLGFQGDYTDPASDEVWMGARWYSGADAVFRSRDSVFGELAMPISLNRYTYAAGNPLRYWDPDGRYLIEGTGGSDETIPGGSSNPTYQSQGWARRKAPPYSGAYYQYDVTAWANAPKYYGQYTTSAPRTEPASVEAVTLEIELGSGTAADMKEFLADHGALTSDWDDGTPTQQFAYFSWVVLKNTGHTNLSQSEFRSLPVESMLQVWNDHRVAALREVRRRDCKRAMNSWVCENRGTLIKATVVGAAAAFTGGAAALPLAGAMTAAGVGTVTTGIATGAVGGAVSSVTAQLGFTGRVDVGTVARDTLIGGGIGGAFAGVGKAYNALRARNVTSIGNRLDNIQATTPPKPSRTPAADLADSYPRPPGIGDPRTVAVLETRSGGYYPGRSGFSGPPHPAVQEALDTVPRHLQPRFFGKCAELQCLSRALEAGDDVAGATISTARVRGLNSAAHGTPIPPCSACRWVLPKFGVR